MTGITEIVPYDEGWGEEFAAVDAGLRDALGGLALRIDHIGSTAVPGLDAKDVIDVQLTVAALNAETFDPALERAGFGRDRESFGLDHRPPGEHGPDSDWAKLFYSPLEGRRVHLHVRAAGAPNQRYALLFGDYLRAHSRARDAYGELKRRLAGYRPIPTGDDAEIKAPVCDIVMAAAEEWAAAAGWTPSHS